MDKPHQKIGSKSNPDFGRDFEVPAQNFFVAEWLVLEFSIIIPVGVVDIKKDYVFDLRYQREKVLVEYKSHKWTTPNDNIPSSTPTVWNDAKYYSLATHPTYRKIMFVLRDFCESVKKHYHSNVFVHITICPQRASSSWNKMKQQFLQCSWRLTSSVIRTYNKLHTSYRGVQFSRDESRIL